MIPCKTIDTFAALFLNSEDIESIADGMKRIVTDEELRATLINAGYIRAKDFHWQSSAEQTLDVLERVVAGEDIRTSEETLNK